MKQANKHLYGWYFIVLILLSINLPHNLHAQGLMPSDDAHVLQGSSADNNYGSATALQVKESSSFARYSYLKFDLSGVTNISSAKLRLYGGHASLTRTLYCKATGNAWEESSITWNNKPAPGSTLAQTSVATTDWYEWDITDYVQGKEGQVISVVMTSSSSAEAAFNSKENTANPLELVINENDETPGGEEPVDPGSGSTDATLFDFYGVHVGRDSNPSKSFAGLKDMGTGWVRLFADIQDWSDPSNSQNNSSALIRPLFSKKPALR